VSGWITTNRRAFERDVLQDFCLGAEQLAEQFVRLEAEGRLSFAVLKALVGEPMNKGPLWRLKDKAHHLFRGEEAGHNPAGLLLDWTLGYIFHETFKLMEDAHQRQYYGPMLGDFQGKAMPEAAAGLLADLTDIQAQTGESMRREANRLSRLFGLTRRFFCLYFQGRADHRPLARLLHDRQALVRSVFQEDYEEFITAVYGDEPERLHIEAGHSLWESARPEEARAAVAQALAVNPHSAAALALIRLMDAADTRPTP
jgi:hypothetical protein